ncbi:WEE/WEE-UNCLASSIFIED protein kinase [Trichophyton rubrum D6]|uniref:WEE protein kinase n=4 Tax=Trichophyton TaxID=5550 RepID=A0A178EU58_TRIRU|nr:WEE/WEE-UNCLASSIFIED protein kinase [Trichophyton rubrum CBS 118892]EZF10684.1 WEE/WEE-UNCLASSIFIED protein kinase [Trichophyton rubrum MR850]EZF37523.1 WEE/WEE-UNCLASSIFIED protein kinase [Trichophyton rubrum CBS 100081]EZF48217.1 WEE/WEE-UNCLASSIFIED protein kinase [Trichophyton rubrum CBS 288.86]EZF58814.1 WEE/WEE-UNCLASSIFIED protein kinase [Trichophyton rubrum CBS 289.86]EZF69471.1 WEE/WEE-UNCLASSIFIED protein kinase [Trichophyton soudanense CBS 452.61]EZF80125.1 WEE/WEE-UNCLASSIFIED 
MVASFSPHRDAGGTLHLSSSSFHATHKNSALSQLRRSLSRSPSKTTDFRLLSPSTFNSPATRHPNFTSSNLSPSKQTSHGKILFVPNPNTPSPVAIPFPPSAKIHRPPMRRSRFMHSSKTSSSSSSAKRVLGESRDNGNSAASPELPTIDTMDEKVSTTPPSPVLFRGGQESPLILSSPIEQHSEDTSTAGREKRRSGNMESTTPLSSSPLKRADVNMTMDSLGAESPSAKRRSLHGVSFGADFDVFESSYSAVNSPLNNSNPKEPRLQPPGHYFSTIPKRSSSLRRSTIQQRHPERSLFVRKISADNDGSFQLQNKNRMTIDNSTFLPLNGPDSSPSPNPSTSLFTAPSSSTFHPPTHPLSRTITQSSSSSSVGDDSPTNRALSSNISEAKPILNFSKSLPIGAVAPRAPSLLRQESSNASASPFSTPENYKLVKPLPAAFMSTGLISKKNKNVSDFRNSSTMSHNMPETPCKRASNVLFGPKPLHQANSAKFLPYHKSSSSFETPFTHRVKAPSSRVVSTCSRRGSLASIDGDISSIPRSPSAPFDSQCAIDSDLPPTPTRRGLFPQHVSNSAPFQVQAASQPNFDANRGESGLFSSPFYCKTPETGPPRTPRDHTLTPDASSLSITAPDDHTFSLVEANASALPATPTAPRESFPNLGKRTSFPLGGYNSPDIDPCLNSRFDKVELIGTGEFSLVYSVSERVSPPSSQLFQSQTPLSSNSTPTNTGSRKLWAVKKSKQPYAGSKDRERRNNEVVALKALHGSDHIISYIDSWEDKGYLYIQTEFCEEGSLDVFLSQVGLKARLDDFRIWKILLELAHGLKHIHDTGFIHLDLKPANILITFEGVLKIADFGLATRWPAAAGIEGEGDREYIGPEVLMGRYDKPADIFALGLIMFEIAGNVELPDNGVSWQKLRNGDMSDVPSLTWSGESSNILRDASGNPLVESSIGNLSSFDDFDKDCPSEDISSNYFRPAQPKGTPSARSGELAEPPAFMVDADNDQALDKLVGWMISPNPPDRPVADEILQSFGVQWAEQRRRAGATIFEGNWGPADEVLNEDAEMMDV